MKKVLALLLAILMLASVGFASAEETNEITFQDIPWGSNVQYVIQKLLENGIVTNPSGFTEETFEQMLADGQLVFSEDGFAKTFQLEDAGIYIFGSYESAAAGFFMPELYLPYAPDKTIGGYGIKSIRCYFACVGEETRLISVDVDLDWEDNQATYDDLRSKLTTVYGEGKHESLWGDMFNYYRWNGDGNSMVMLSFNDGELGLHYGTLDAEQWLKDAEAGIVEPEKTVDGSDTSGL